jgi:hypothetical protein
VKIPKTNVHKNQWSESQGQTDRQTDRQSDMTKVIFAFRSLLRMGITLVFREITDRNFTHINISERKDQ